MIGRVKRWMNADNAVHTWLLRERVSNADVVLILLFFSAFRSSAAASSGFTAPDFSAASILAASRSYSMAIRRLSVAARSAASLRSALTASAP